MGAGGPAQGHFCTRSGHGLEHGHGHSKRSPRKPTFNVASSRTFTSSMSFFNSSELSREMTDWPG